MVSPACYALRRELSAEVSSDRELRIIHDYYTDWAERGCALQVDLHQEIASYRITVEDGESLRDPITLLYRRVTFEQQQRVRSLIINRIIWKIASHRIDTMERDGLQLPALQDRRALIRETATYLRRQFLPQKDSINHPSQSVAAYHRLEAELHRVRTLILARVRRY